MNDQRPAPHAGHFRQRRGRVSHAIICPVTFSIVARSEDARMFGIAIASASLAVAAHCSHARAGIGAVATQNITDPILGPRMLD
ncbi:MAG TPA: DUF1028 domain-containing protein, partial [Acetobacteraceae bacterium]|nr:DUF1028 domain-containing protein [Acetobacteraceae bacterium]